MLMVIPNQGKEIWLDRALNFGARYAFTDLIIRLYQNDYTPVDGSVVGSFVQATFGGYAAVVLPLSNFPDPTILANIAVTTSALVPVFSCTSGAPQTVYGWYAESGAGGFAMAAQRFDTPRVMSVGSLERLDPFPVMLKTFV